MMRTGGPATEGAVKPVTASIRKYYHRVVAIHLKWLLRRSRQAMPSLTSLATASPPHTISQAEIVGAARHVFAARGRDFDRLVPAYDNAGIETRQFCAPLDWYLEPHGWPERSALFVEHADALLEHTARKCLDGAGIGPEAVDALVVVSSTGIATPSLDARLMERMAFRRDIVRLPIFGLGCAGGALGLGRADALARAMPGSRVLLLVVELCSLTFRRQDLCKSNIIASALFGDGAAAALIEHSPDAAESGRSPVKILASGEHTWPDSLDVMGWNIEEDGFGVLFSRDIPNLVETCMRPVVDDFLARQGLRVGDLDGVVAHPGGTKVIAAIASSLELDSGELEVEADILRRFGNMSSVTVLFVLDEKRRRGDGGLRLLFALGPGFTLGMTLVES